jgi:uncharacterized protein YndB with AHSA1/START domain
VTADLPQPSAGATRLERTHDVPAEIVWELWTTPAGIEEWSPRVIGHQTVEVGTDFSAQSVAVSGRTVNGCELLA